MAGGHAFGAAHPPPFAFTLLRHDRGGTDVPTDAPVVLVHGLGFVVRTRLARRGLDRPDRRRGSRRDPRRHPRPRHRGAPHDPAAYADLEQSVGGALPDVPVDAIGFSLGAQLLLRLAASDPSRFRRLVVIGAGANVFRTDSTEGLASAFETGAGDDEIAARVFVSLAAEAGNDPLAMAACLRRPPRPLTPDEVARVTCPVLVILGDKDFAGPPDPLLDALPDARLVTLRGIDHFQSPRDFACIDAALDFIGAAPG